MSPEDERAHRNLCDFTRFTAQLDRGGRVFDERGVVALIGSSDWPSSRTAVRSDHVLAAPEWADTVTDLFDDHGKTGCVFARVGVDDDLVAELVPRGFTEWAQTPEMVCAGGLPPREPPSGVTVRLAATASDVSAYAEIAGRAFAHLSIPERMTREHIDNPEVLLRPDCAIALAELDGTPVAGADEARGRGLGDVVTRAVTNEAFDRGARLVTLEASEFGEGTYARMGYREIYRYRVLIRV